MRSTIVIPTIREDYATKWWEAWKDQLKDQRVIMVIDKPKEEAFSLPGVETYHHGDIDTQLDDDSWAICRRTSAIRNFGTLKALEQPTDMIWHLDDDCMPSAEERSPYLDSHWANLYDYEVYKSWFSTDESGNHLRGMPYGESYRPVQCVVSHGTWLLNPDYDAPHQLANRFEFKPFVGVIPLGSYFTMCGMNLAFKPEVATAMYFAPSGGQHPYDRFDDIWMGIIAKRVFDHLRLYCYSGYPQVIHDRASDPFKNLIKEAPGIEANEGFWQYIDELSVTGQTVEGCMEEVATQMVLNPYRDEDYFRHYGQSLQTWLKLLQHVRQ